MDHLQISLLGIPTISWGEKVLAFPRRQVRALLYRLSTDLQSVSREELCFLFWADDPYPNARRHLTHLLTHLRAALPTPDLVDITKENVALNIQWVWSDTAEFDRLLSERQVTDPGTDGSDYELKLVLNALENAARVYRGPFLSGFTLPGCREFEAWASRKRQDYECRYLETLLDLVEVYQDYQDYETAISYAKRYLEIDNLAESIHCKLIELNAAKGDRSAAERQFEQLAEVLEQELSISPSPKTWALYQSVLGSRQPAVLLPTQALANKMRSRLEAPFVGRERILKLIEREFNLACLGRSKLVLISGEPGIGKSRLLQEIASRYHSRASVLFSMCSPGMVNLQFYPIAEAFRCSLAAHAPNIKVSHLWLAEAARLLPEIYSRYPDLPQPLSARPEEARRRLFEALYQLASSLSSRSCPLLLCFDDLHWADASSLEWLIYLGNRLAFEGSNHLMVIATCQVDEIIRLNELRFALNRLGMIEEHLLDDLDPEEVGEYLDHLSGSRGSSRELAGSFHRISGGNPLLLFEVLRVLTENQSLPLKRADLEDIPIPRTVQEAVYQRLACLNPQQWKILEIAAVINRSFTKDIMQKATGWRDLDVIESLDTLAARRLLVGQEGEFYFHHELVRMVIYRDLSYDRRRFFHRRCGKILEQKRPREYALLAWHFEQGGEPHKAARYALRAGEDASRKYAYREALDFFSRALALLKQVTAALRSPDRISRNYRLQIMVLSRRGSAFRMLGDMQSYQNDFEEEARIARVLGDDNVLAQVHVREAKAHRWFCRYSQAIECAEKALQIGHVSGNELVKGRALREMGLAERDAGNFASARLTLEKALQCFKNLGEAGDEIRTLCNLSSLHAVRGEFRLAEQLAASALGRCEQARLPDLRRLALGDLGVALAGLGLDKQARDSLLSSLEIARQVSDRTQEIFCLCRLGQYENHAGRPEEALIYLRSGLALAERLDARAEQSRLYASIAVAYRLLQNTRLAYGLAHKALELAHRHGRPYDQDLAQQVLADLKSDLSGLS